MKKIIKFKDKVEFAYYLRDKVSPETIGEGSEGYCLLSKDKKDVYKIMEYPAEDYDIDKIITTYDFNPQLEYIIFPEELYVSENNKLLGYKTKYIKEENIFDFDKITDKNFILSEIKNYIRFSTFYKLLKEIEILSDHNILIYDLSWNLYYTGENLYAIDTCGYKKVNKDVRKDNREKLEEALLEVMDTYNFFHEESNVQPLCKKRTK